MKLCDSDNRQNAKGNGIHRMVDAEEARTHVIPNAFHVIGTLYDLQWEMQHKVILNNCCWA